MSGVWRRDPTGRFEYRWWEDGRYTEWVARDGEQLVDPEPVPEGPSTIEVGFGPVERQNRWSVGFRLVLVIPHLAWITIVTVAALFVLVAGWFAALATARLPVGIERFLHRVVRYHVRLLAYLFLLCDDYPPFALGSDRSPIVVETNPGPLNRFAVAFRLVLALPVLVVASWLSGGIVVSLIVIWVIVLAQGRMPPVVAQAVTAVLRFEARTYGYVMLLASAYPSGLYGDPEPYTAEVAPTTTEPAAAPAPHTTRLVLARGARRLVTLFLVLGILQNVASNLTS